jgi:phenylalanyl-tRNA synthetase beta chain
MGYTGARAKSYRIANPMSEDTPVLRTHLLPGLAAVASRNIGRGAKNFAIFEVGSIFRNTQDLAPAISPELGKRPSQKDIDAIFNSVPAQLTHLGAILIGNVEGDSWRGKSRAFEWSDAIGFAQDLLRTAGLTWTIARSDFAPWHPGRCAELLVDGTPVAHAGELHPRVVSQFGLTPRASAFVINLDALPETGVRKAKTIAVMPPAIQDVALIVDSTTPAADVEAALRAGAGELLESVTLFDRYDQLGDGKISLAFTLVFRAHDRTLTGAEITEARESAVSSAMQKCGAILRTI